MSTVPGAWGSSQYHPIMAQRAIWGKHIPDPIFGLLREEGIQTQEVPAVTGRFYECLPGGFRCDEPTGDRFNVVAILPCIEG